MDVDVGLLQQRIRTLEAQLHAANAELQQMKSASEACDNGESAASDNAGMHGAQHNYAQRTENGPWPDLPLLLEEYQRYSRQLIMPEVGLQGQLRIKASRVLLVGAGGLGCPAAAYLAGAGVGSLGIVDGDIVEASNLHRQILHSTGSVGMPKAESIKAYVHSLNPLVRCEAFVKHLSTSNVVDIMSQYDLILDCTDNPASRYLISDAAVLLGKPLISASALRTEGQLVVLNHPVAPPGDIGGGPCYRCVFPNPPAPEIVTSCGEGGILGPVVGVMGVMQALEAIKLLARGSSRSSSDLTNAGQDSPRASMLMYSAFDASPFRTFKLRGRRKDCRACSPVASISTSSLRRGAEDYLQLCGAALPVNVLEDEERIKPAEFASILKDPTKRRLVVDVREKSHFDVFSLPGSVNIPYSTFSGSGNEDGILQTHQALAGTEPVYVLCRLGNDSQHAVKKLKSLGLDKSGDRQIQDVAGGWQAWRRDIPGIWPDF